MQLAAKALRPLLRAATSLKQQKYRDKNNLILLEGWRLVKDALSADIKPVNIFISEKNVLDKFPGNAINNDQVIIIDAHEMRRLSCNVTPPGIVGMFEKPVQGGTRRSLSQADYRVLPLTVICDKLRDPSNLGTLIRVCAASGCSSLLTTKGSIDIWNPKVLRCAAGGHFHLSLFPSLSWEDVHKQVFNSNTRIFIADSNITDVGHPLKSHYEVDWCYSHNVLIIGGETTGPSEEARQLVKDNKAQSIRIPMTPGVDSLSAAISATVIIYEAYRQQFTSGAIVNKNYPS